MKKSGRVGALVEVAERCQESLLPLLGLLLEPLLEQLLIEAPSLVPVTTMVLVAPTLLVGASLIAVAVAVVVEVVVLATAGFLGAVGDEVVRIAAVVAPRVLPPLPVVVDCNTRFIKEHKPSNHIRARIKSHVYTTE